MVSLLNRKNRYTKRRPMSPSRKARQLEILSKARAIRASKPIRPKIFSNRELTAKLLLLDKPKTQLDNPSSDDDSILDIVVESVNDIRDELDVNRDDFETLKLELKNLTAKIVELEGRLSDTEEDIGIHEDRLDTHDADIIDLIKN